VVGKKEEESQRDRQNKSLNGTAKCPKGSRAWLPRGARLEVCALAKPGPFAVIRLDELASG
jgi:hypothetical protein